MIKFRPLDNMLLKLHSKSGIVDQQFTAGAMYNTEKVVVSKDKNYADVYFKDGCAEKVPMSTFELHGHLDEIVQL